MSAIDYDLRKIKGIVFDVDGVLSPSTISMDIAGEPIRMVNIKDGYAIQLAIKRGFKICIITGARNDNIIHRYKALGVKDIYISASVKIDILKNWVERNNFSPEQIVYMGDDIPDLECLEYSGLSSCPKDAAIDIKQICRYISHEKGGYGCARDLLEQIMKAQNKWLIDNIAFGW